MAKKESKFKKLQGHVEKEYEKKGKSAKEAKRIGGAVAYEVGEKKHGKEYMEKKAHKGREDSLGRRK